MYAHVGEREVPKVTAAAAVDDAGDAADSMQFGDVAAADAGDAAAVDAGEMEAIHK